jgi:hypothetical protein
MWGPNLTLAQPPFDHAQEGPFPLSILLAPIIARDQIPNLPPFPQHVHNLHLKSLTPHVSTNLPIEG